MKVYSATGRRKTSVAQVRLVSGTGKVLINKRTIDDYFPVEVWRIHALSPLQVTDNLGKFDVFVNVRGGGLTGQSGAIRLGIARALVEYDEQLRSKLREYELLTR
ncbi:MAG TPA: 30S ribosomal protein S9, partial [Candidatus Kapabacteria bacterium]|nr:30S ribosomal protein S9 [Candidatus Kapabacteria bacterium]